MDNNKNFYNKYIAQKLICYKCKYRQTNYNKKRNNNRKMCKSAESCREQYFIKFYMLVETDFTFQINYVFDFCELYVIELL